MKAARVADSRRRPVAVDEGPTLALGAPRSPDHISKIVNAPGRAVGAPGGLSEIGYRTVLVEESVRLAIYGAGANDLSDGKELLSALRFYPPSRSVRSLGLPDANAPEILYAAGDPELAELERASHEATAQEEPGATFEASALGGETRIAEGCWRADPDFFVQTQFGSRANTSPKDDIPRGWTIVGNTKYWDEYTNGRVSVGRCSERSLVNTKF